MNRQVFFIPLLIPLTKLPFFLAFLSFVQSLCTCVCVCVCAFSFGDAMSSFVFSVQQFPRRDDLLPRVPEPRRPDPVSHYDSANSLQLQFPGNL